MMLSVPGSEIDRDTKGNPIIDERVKSQFENEGYVLVKNLLGENELNILRKTVETNEKIKKYAYGRDDGCGRKAKVVLWNQPGSDVTGIIARSNKVAGTMEKLLDGEVYHYHSKIIMKDAHTGGMHVWHQDYGYWYNNGCLYPNMATVFIAIDKAHIGNGCLRIIGGSHKMGRLDHVRIGDQAGVEEDRMKEVLQRSQLLHAQMDPGDALFFHCNVLHTSAQNKSEDRRWALLCAYNRADNNPVIKHHHAQYSPLNKVENSEILKCEPGASMDGKDFFSLEQDVSMEALDPNFIEEMRR